METTLSNRGNRWIIKQFVNNELVNFIVFLDENKANEEFKKLKK